MKIWNRLDRWFGERYPMPAVKAFARQQAAKPLPPHTSWFHTFGSLSLFLLVNQIVTGILLMIYYRPTTDDAFASVRFITVNVSFGWLIRGLHAWGATMMIVMLILHMMRTFFMGAYKKPRELTWVIGVFLMIVTVIFGFTGYLLPWSKLSYWATTIGTEMADAVPFIGETIKRVLLGGDEVSGETLARFYVLHVIVLPWVIVFLVAVHLVLMRTQGLATLDRVGEEVTLRQAQGDHERSRLQVGTVEWVKPSAKTGLPFFPHHVLKEMVVFSLFLGFMVTLVVLWPVELGEKADPNVSPTGIKPEWYFLPTYQLLKYIPHKLLGLFISVIPMLLLLLWPFIDRTPERRPSKRPVSVTIGIVAIVLALILGLLGHYSESNVVIFGEEYHIDQYGIPREPIP